MMIGVIIAAGVGVDWWDATHGRPLPKPAEVTQAEDEGVKRLGEEIERLKTDNALLNIQNDALQKQIDEMNQKPPDAPKTVEEPAIVEGQKALGD